MIKIVINSHKNSTIALNYLLQSIEKYKEKYNNEIIICIGGFYENKDYILEKKDQITYIYCNHNSIDYTGLIAISDLFLNSDDIYVYLHDTCSIGPNFYSIINSLNITGNSARIWHPSMNIGIYKTEIIRQQKNFLDSCKNFSDENLQFYKNQAVKFEDYIFYNDPSNEFLKSDQTCLIQSDPKPIYNQNVLRVIEYYKCLDLYKYKANWFGKDVWELNN